ncbi:MAG: DICT sensory domain-containing protein [Salinirussus sp.]
MAAVESVKALIDRVDAEPATLLVLNRTEPAPFLNLLSSAFERQPVHVVEREVPGPISDEVILVDKEGVRATSHLTDLAEGFLLINSDQYRTSARNLEESAVPAVLRELTDIAFDLRGYPASNKEKLLLIVMSRYIEARALRIGSGELRAAFQRLSRLDDEYGTRMVYERLADTDVETHVYGVDDDLSGVPENLHVHADDTEEYRRSWFVTFESESGYDEAVALVAWETGENHWRGSWTFDPAKTRSVVEYIRTL